MASASSPSGVLRMKAARLVCIARSEVGVETTAIENAGRVESGFEAAMNFHQRRGKRCEDARAAVVAEAGAEDRRVAAGLLRADAHRLRVGVRDPPALRAAPFHQLRAGQ